MANIVLVPPIYVNVAQFQGGDPTGATASDTAFTNALAAIPTSTGGTLYIPPNSTYLLQNGIDISAYSGNLVIMGGGNSSVLKLANGANTYLIKSTSGSQTATRISNLMLDCNSANQTAASGGIYGYKWRRCVIDNVHIHNPWQAGIYLIGVSNDFGYQNRIHNCWIEGGSSVSSGTNAYGNGLRLEYTNENEVYANSFENNGNFNDATYGFHIYDKTGGNAFTDNVFLNGYGVLKLDGLQDVVKGNKFDSNGAVCVQVNSGATDTIIAKNHLISVGFRSSGGSANSINGIYLNATRCIVRDNNCWSDTSATPKTNSFVNIDTGATYSLIEGNEFNIRASSGTLAGPVTYVSGIPAGCRVEGNTGYNFVGSYALGDLPWFNVKSFGVTGNGTTDDTSLIASAITACSNAGGGIVYFPPGTYAISSPLTLSTTGVRLAGAGQASTLQPTAGFSGAQIVNITADFCGVTDMMIAFANTSYASNPAANGVQITGARSVVLSNVYLNYINGWAVQSTATSGVANYYNDWRNVHAYQCKQGTHVLGVSGSNFNMALYMVDCTMDQIQNGDAYLFEDCHDILCANLEGNVTAGSGNTLHVKGACAAVYLTNADFGPAPGPSTGATVLIETGTNGTPKQIGITTSIVEGGSTGLSITAGTQLHFTGCDFINNGTYGINITGGDGIIFDACTWNINGSTAGAGHYDFQSSTTGHVTVSSCTFMTPQGTGTQQVANVANVTAGVVVFNNDTFQGTGFTPANIFNNKPSVIRGCSGYNPVGSVTAPAFPATTVAATNNTGSDVTAFIANDIGAITVVQIAGAGGTYVTTGYQIAASGWGSVRLPAGGSVKFTYASGSPTWTWFSD